MPPPGLRPLLRHPWLLDPPATWPGDETRISVIVPTRNGGTMLREALASLAAKAARPTLLEPLVIDNGSDAPETLAILAGLGCPVLRLDEPFNWSRLNNQAVARTRGGILLFLNDDTRMLSEGWDLWLRRLLAEPEVGAVGARLLYEDMTIQHAGVLLGQEKLAAHEGVGAAAEEGGPGGRWQALRAAGAVTGAFLGCRREAFLGVGGFDETSLPITFNDVDLCLKLRAAGLQVLYAPQIALLHYESKSRGHDDADRGRQERAEAEAQRLTERWGEGLLLDPGCNPHWSRWARPFSALREPSAAEIARHLAATASERPWDPLGALPPGPRQRALPSALPPGGRASLRTLP
nr:glycosyltransferase [Siccirubricoccus soli]